MSATAGPLAVRRPAPATAASDNAPAPAPSAQGAHRRTPATRRFPPGRCPGDRTQHLRESLARGRVRLCRLDSSPDRGGRIRWSTHYSLCDGWSAFGWSSRRGLTSSVWVGAVALVGVAPIVPHWVSPRVVPVEAR